VVVVAISTGFGKFKVVTDSGTNTLTDRHTLVVADANGDGLSDLLVVDERPVGNVSRLDVKVGTSGGDGSFVWNPTQQTNFEPAGPNQTSRLLVGDFNADSRADLLLVIANDNGSGGSFTTFTSQGDTTRQFLVRQSVVTGEMPTVSVADWTGDGLDDLVLTIAPPQQRTEWVLRATSKALLARSRGSGGGDGIRSHDTGFRRITV